MLHIEKIFPSQCFKDIAPKIYHLYFFFFDKKPEVILIFVPLYICIFSSLTWLWCVFVHCLHDSCAWISLSFLDLWFIVFIKFGKKKLWPLFLNNFPAHSPALVTTLVCTIGYLNCPTVLWCPLHILVSFPLFWIFFIASLQVHWSFVLPFLVCY